MVNVAGMENIRAKINIDLTWPELIKVTADHLAANNLLLCLHLDEFVPFDETGAKNNTKENFYKCWRRMLLPILETPGIFLYISGRLPYFDSFGSPQPGGQSPYRVLSVQLNLFSAEIIYDALSKMAILSLSEVPTLTAAAPAQSVATTALLDALDALPSVTAMGVAQRLYYLTGGVPRLIGFALPRRLQWRHRHAPGLSVQ